MKESFKFKDDHWRSLRDVMKEILAGKLDEKNFWIERVKIR